MHVWDYPRELASKADIRWQLERKLSFGLAGAKIRRAELERHLAALSIPDSTRAFMELLLWRIAF